MLKLLHKIMSLFTKFKMMFNKTINLLPHQRNDVVSFVRLRKGMVKIGSEAVVEEDYNLVFVYYNKVCDILQPGTYKINEDTIPKLFKFSKSYLTKKGFFIPKTITSDVYFVRLKEFNHNMFKTAERITAYNGDEKVKIRLEGTFTFRVCDVDKFMNALCNDYAIIRNKKIMKELCSTVGFESSKALNGKKFTIDDFIYNKEKICQAIEEGVNKHTQTFGVEVCRFFVGNIVAPKKHLNVSQIESIDKKEFTKQTENVDVAKLVEDRLNNLQKDLSVVYVNEKGENSFENSNHINSLERVDVPSSENISKIDINSLGNQGAVTDDSTNPYAIKKNQKFGDEPVEPQTQTYFEEPTVSTTPDYSQPEPNILSSEPNETGVEQKPVKHKKASKNEDLSIDDELVDTLIDKINSRKKQKKNNRIVEILTSAGIAEPTTSSTQSSNKTTCSHCGAEMQGDAKFCPKCGKSVDELKVCACCGAKNFATAESCCVCKSKLD